jgi:predicted transcriptional regulator
MKQTITIRIPKEVRRELQAISKAGHVPMSNLVRDSLRKLIAVRRFQQLRNKVLPFAEAGGLLTDEDVFRHL